MLFKNSTIYTMEQDPFIGDFRVSHTRFSGWAKASRQSIFEVLSHDIDNEYAMAEFKTIQFCQLDECRDLRNSLTAAL